MAQTLNAPCAKPLIESTAMSSDLRMLDSSAVIRHFRQGGEATARLEALAGLFLPTVALGELYAGAHRSARPDKNLAQIETFLGGVTVVPVDDETAKHFGRISAQLAADGLPIPQNDMWIAACAMQWGLALATADEHFNRITGLNVDKWA